jgi:hypothetical protein
MTDTDLLRNLASRPLHAASMFLPGVDPGLLNLHPGGHANSPAWLLWHAAREMDLQVAEIAGREQIWASGGFSGRFGLRLDEDDIGYGHSRAQAESVRVSEDEAGRELLHDYLAAVTAQIDQDLAALSDEDLDRVLDSSYDPPVTVGVRLISAFDDAAQHICQAAYVLGMPAPAR